MPLRVHQAGPRGPGVGSPVHGPRPSCPNEETYNAQLSEVGLDGYPPVLDKLKAAAQERGLWNLFLPHLRPGNPGTPLSNLDYAPISEMLGKVSFASEVLKLQTRPTPATWRSSKPLRIRRGSRRGGSSPCWPARSAAPSA